MRHDDEDGDGYVDVEVNGTVRVYTVTRMRREDAEQIQQLRGSELRTAVDREVVFNTTDIVEIEDIENFNILETDKEEEE